LQVAQLTVRRWVASGRLTGRLTGRRIGCIWVVDEAATAELELARRDGGH
jgi:hypothetical protein